MQDFLEVEKRTPGEVKAEANVIMGGVKDYAYANATYLSISNWDIRIAFCERLPSGETVPRVAVVMPHSQAKAFSEMLSRQIAKLEDAMGEIRWQPKKGSEDAEESHG